MEKKDGILLPRMSPELWQELKTFPLRHDDVFIVTYPKSGTTWIQQIVKLLRNGGRGDDVPLDHSIPWLEILNCDLGKMMGYTPDMASLSDVLSPRVFKSHFPYDLVPGGLPHTTPAKYVYVIRNPKDVCVSAWHHTNMMREDIVKKTTWDEHVTLALSSDCPYGNWFDEVVKWWKHKDAPNILFVKYEDMKSDPSASTRRIAEFIGIENVTDELIHSVMQNASLVNMKKDVTANHHWMFGSRKFFTAEDKAFIRKGVVGNWREYFSDEQSKHFDDMFTEKVADSGLTIQFE